MWLQFHQGNIGIHRKHSSTSTLTTRLFGYDFSIFHRSVIMMKDINVLSRNINSIIHQYLVTASIIRCDDLKSRSFGYNYDLFHSCSNPYHVKGSATTLLPTSPYFPVPSILYHIPLRFFQTPSILHQFTYPSITSKLFISPEESAWLYFDSVSSTFGHHLYPWYGGSVT